MSEPTGTSAEKNLASGHQYPSLYGSDAIRALLKIAKSDGQDSKSLLLFLVLVNAHPKLTAHSRIIENLLVIVDTRRYLLVVDESYYLKNGESYRSAIVEKLRSKCRKCFVLCGTPAPNSAHDLVNQFDLADLGYTFGGFNKSNDPAADWDKIATLVDTKGVFIRRLKPDILQHVPEKNFHVISVELAGKQALMYAKAKSALELELRSLNNESFKKSLLTYFQKRAALLQICSCPSSIDPTASEVPVKYTVLDDLLDKLISQGRKVVLWSFYKIKSRRNHGEIFSI